MGQLGPPKLLFLVWIKNKFSNHLYLGWGIPMPNLRFLNIILVDPIRHSLGRK